MKKVIIGMIAIILISGLYVYANKLYYPQSPIKDLTAKEILDKLKGSNADLVQLSEQNDLNWYIIKKGDGGIQTTDEIIKHFLLARGWSFTAKEGSGLFFEKASERLIVTTQMWTSQYVLVQMPAKL